MKHLAFLVALACTLPAPAMACMNEVELTLSDVTASVRRAESALSAGRLRQAYRLSMAALSDIGSLREEREPLRARALLVNSLAAVRLEGRVNRSARMSAARVLERALMSLRSLHLASPQDVQRSAALAEALFLDPAAHDEAFELLSPLESVLPGVHAHAVLARLYAERGDTAGRDRVLARCQARASGRERNVCRAIS